VAIIGAGFGGLGLAHHLRTQGIDDLVLVERASTVGGTWRDNTYPGAQCDVPAHLYSFSCAPNPDWSRTYADGPEIQAYLEGFADQFGLRPLIRFNTAVSAVCWNDQQRHWDITTSNGSLTATSVVVATGLLSEPDMAAVPGIDTFDGEVFHSGGWRHDVELAGRRGGWYRCVGHPVRAGHRTAHRSPHRVSTDPPVDRPTHQSPDLENPSTLVPPIRPDPATPAGTNVLDTRNPCGGDDETNQLADTRRTACTTAP
jgi:2-polyprenyl-6-methoxyphenol hydroxylase-like FAD-dependent oxidoreductase